jgi:hypothetical protein
MTFRTYTAATLAFIATAMGLTFAALRYMDPFYVFGAPDRAGINAVRYGAVDYPELAKIYSLNWYHPRSLILGSSRAQIGLDPAHPGFAHRPVYNLAYPGATMSRALALFQNAVATEDVKQVVIGLDFFMFRVGRTTPRQTNVPELARLAVQADGTPTPLLRKWRARAEDFWTASFSGTAINLAVIDWFTNSQTWDIRRLRWIMKRDGHNEMRNRQDLQYEPIFDAVEGAFLRDFSNGDFCLRAATGYSALDDLRTLVRGAREHGIDLKILISPAHASYFEIIDKTGLWATWETWKREIVRIAEEETGADRPVPVYDFSGFTSITTEPVPIGAPAVQMTNYWDPSHYTKEIGDRVLDIMLSDANQQVRPDIGGPITLRNIDEHLASIRLAQSVWRSRAPEQAARVKGPAHPLPAESRCPDSP